MSWFGRMVSRGAVTTTVTYGLCRELLLQKLVSRTLKVRPCRLSGHAGDKKTIIRVNVPTKVISQC
jgi:hypothetical protein